MRMMLVAVLAASPAAAEQIGEVTTAIKILGANHRIVVEAFDDPKVEGVACFVSRARTGGISGSLGLAEDTSDASINCQQTGAVKFRGELEDGEEVFSRRASVLFKRVQVVRFFDQARNDASQAAGDMKNDAKQAANDVKTNISDATITASVNAKLAADKELSALRINVDTSDGRVALHGTAPNSAARERATQIAAAVDGVRSVDNQLQIAAS